jgi:DNA-binding transcriptional ArsR family regulator
MLNYQTTLDKAFHALADPGRRAMLVQLSKGDASVSDLAEPLDMSLPAVVQHLAVLVDAGLVSSSKAGRVRTCRMEAAGLATAERWIADRRALWEGRLDALGRYLAETRPSGRKKGRRK